MQGDRGHLLVANVGSDDVSVFAVTAEGLSLIGTSPSGSPAPRSLAERDGPVCVLNTGKPSINGFRLADTGLVPVVGAEHPLSAENADPAQVGFTPDGRMLIATERGTDSVVAYEVGTDGVLGAPVAISSSGPGRVVGWDPRHGRGPRRELSRGPRAWSRCIA